MTEVVFIVLFCAMLMRMKGGGIINADADGKLCSALCFSLLIFGLSGKAAAALLAGCGWLYLCSPAVRDYLTNLGGYKSPLSFFGWGQHKYVVKICDYIFEKFGQNIEIGGKTHRRFYGWLGTTIRGVLPSAGLALILSPVFLIAGILMAPAYYAGISWWQYQRTTGTELDDIADGWSLGEWFWGGVIGLAVYYWYEQGCPTIIDFFMA